MPWDQWWFWVLVFMFAIPILAVIGESLKGIARALRGPSEDVEQLREQVSELREQLAEARAAEKVLELQRQLTQREEQQLQQHVLNSGVAVIGFTDIEGFSTYADRHGDQAASELLSRHNEVVRSALRRHHGFEIKQLGDGFMVSFASAQRALLCMIEIQQEIRELQGTQNLDLNVRIGVHAGEAIQDDQDVIGRTVNIAERVMDAARGGQVLVSEVVRSLAGPVPELAYVDQGEHQLKGFDEPQRLYEIRPAHESNTG